MVSQPVPKKLSTISSSITSSFWFSSGYLSLSDMVIPQISLSHYCICSESFDDNKFVKYFRKIYSKLSLMEKVKYLEPKFTTSVKDLAEFLKI